VPKLLVPTQLFARVSAEGAPERARPSDPEIVAGLLQGEPWAADELYDRVQPYVERTLRRVLRHDRGEYEDLLQSSFERIIRVLSERPLGGACDLPRWSSAVAAHVALDALRRRGRERKLFQHEPAPEHWRGTESSPARALEARFDLEDLERALSRMRPKHAEALLLHDVLGYDLAEVATLTSVTAAAAQSRLVRGRKDLLRRAKARRESS
jgi:RNA polymerase sigma-70 factor (ECF subfamily)